MPTPGVKRFVQSDYSDSSKDATTYLIGIDKAIAVFKRIGDWFAPHQVYAGSPNPDLAVEVDPGCLFVNNAIVEAALQQVSGFTIPSAGQNRIDRVVVDTLTGAASRVAGTAVTGSPTATPPAIPAGKMPLCQVLLSSADTAVLDSMITDERMFATVGSLLTPKAILNYNLIADTITYSVGITSVVRQETGVFKVTFSTAFADTNYLAVGMSSIATIANTAGVLVSYNAYEAKTTTTHIYANVNTLGTLQNVDEICIAFYGA